MPLTGCVTLSISCNFSKLWLFHWEEEQLQCWLPKWMIRTPLFLWAAEKLSDQLSKTMLALCHVLGSAGPYSGHKVTGIVVIVMLTRQGFHGYLGP